MEAGGVWVMAASGAQGCEQELFIVTPRAKRISWWLWRAFLFLHPSSPHYFVWGYTLRWRSLISWWNSPCSSSLHWNVHVGHIFTSHYYDFISAGKKLFFHFFFSGWDNTFFNHNLYYMRYDEKLVHVVHFSIIYVISVFKEQFLRPIFIFSMTVTINFLMNYAYLQLEITYVCPTILLD